MVEVGPARQVRAAWWSGLPQDAEATAQEQAAVAAPQERATVAASQEEEEAGNAEEDWLDAPA